MKINKEGYRIILCSGAVCLLLWLLIYYLIDSRDSISLLGVSTLLLVLFWFFIVAFFREPRRVRIHDADLVFAPCDGRVVVTEVVTEDEYLKREMLQISIFMSITNVHMNWVPVGGEVTYYKYHPGRFLVAWHPKSSTENERTTTVVKTPSGCEVLFRQVAGLIARRIVSYKNLMRWFDLRRAYTSRRVTISAAIVHATIIHANSGMFKAIITALFKYSAK